MLVPPDRTATAKSKSLLVLFFRKEHFLLFLAVPLLLAAALFTADRIFPPDLHRARTLSLELQASNGETLNWGVSRDGMWRLRTAAADVDPAYLALLLQVEDKRFALHPGVDPLALLRAIGQFAAHGRIVSGGSTLTMQVARLLTPHRHDVMGKLQDIARALQLEAHYSKLEILSLYLTLAPFGGNIEGVRAASLRYFGHGPARLSRAEAALLVALPQSPTRRRPDRFPLAAQEAAQAVLRRTGDMAPITIAVRVAPVPRLAPHLAAWKRANGQSGTVRTTLDAGLQRQILALAQMERPSIGADADMAALVVRNDDRAVLAYLGGSNFFGRAGMVDMVRAHRSPGSALKPFIYAMAFDDSLILPDTLIEDAPMRIADYAPQDFDRAFRGTVSAREALQQSYNLPAVALLDYIGAPRFAAVLRQAGAVLELPPGAEATLPLALGGVAMSLWDLQTLYVALATGGEACPLIVVPGPGAACAGRIVSTGAASQVRAILRDAPRPVGVAANAPRQVAYKTGTSYGFRDAWAFGVTPGYSVGVWVGRADGTPRPGAFARGTAAPLLFRLFDLLPEEAAAPDMDAPAPPGPRARALLRLPGRGQQEGGPRILYPPAGAVLELPAGAALALEASGGTRPYHWAINGLPLPDAAAGQAPSWVPDGPGFAHLTLTDAAQNVVDETVRVQ
jgi:penicillin-binding protein 1C